VIRSEPDGLIVTFQPEKPGIGLAKLRFRNLPESLRNQYGYDANRAATYEADNEQGAAQLRTQQSAADNTLRVFRNLAEIHRSTVGDQPSTLSISIEADGKVSVQDQVQPYLYPYGYQWQSGVATENGFRPVLPYAQFAPFTPVSPFAPFGAPFAPFAFGMHPQGLTPTGY
jgi:hypothetical protein